MIVSLSCPVLIGDRSRAKPGENQPLAPLWLSCGAKGPDNVDGFVEGVGCLDYVGGAAVAARGLAVPDGPEFVGEGQHVLAGGHVGFAGGFGEGHAVDLGGLGEEFAVLGVVLFG